MSAIVLTSKPGLQSVSALSIPKDWDQTWMKNFVSNVLKGGDVRNAIAGPGITITGNLASPYATISAGGGGTVAFTGPVSFSGGVTFTNTPYAIVVKGDKAVYDLKNSLGNDVLQIGTYEAWLGSGTDNTDAAIGASSSLFLFAGNNTTATLRINSAGALGIQGYGPTAGGLVDMTPDTGTFTVTLTGCTTSPTATAVWARIGNLVILVLPALTGTSNTTSMTMTGLPTEIQASRNQFFTIPGIESGGAIITTADSGVEVVASSGSLSFFVNNSSSGFGNTLVKGLDVACTIAYLLN